MLGLWLEDDNDETDRLSLITMGRGDLSFLTYSFLFPVHSFLRTFKSNRIAAQAHPPSKNTRRAKKTGTIFCTFCDFTKF